MNNFFIKIITDKNKSFSKNFEDDQIFDKSLNCFYVLDELQIVFSKGYYNLLKKDIDEKYVVLCSISHEDKDFLCKKYNLSFDLQSSKIVLQLFLKHGNDLFKDFGNKFFFFLYDIKNKNFSIFRDHIGFYNIYYCQNNEEILLSSRLTFISNNSNKKFNINKKNLKKFLQMIPIGSGQTFFEEINKVPMNCSLLYKNSMIELEYYEKFKDLKNDENSKQQIIGLKEQLKKAIMSYSERNDKRLGFLFSGGLDSSTVISFYKKYKKSNQKLFAYTATFDHIKEEVKRFIDERDFQQEITRNKDIEDRSFKAQNLSTLSNLDKYIELIGQPFFFPNLYISAESFRLASKDGVEKVFNGNDGDSVISHGFEYFLEMFLKLRWISLYKSIKKVAYINNKSIIFVFKRALLDQIFFYNKIFFSAKEKHKAILSTPIHSNAIEIESLVANHYGIQEVYPFYNMNLVNFCINVRPDLKINGFPRYILRQAIKGIVPEKIRNRTDKANLGHGLVQSFIDKDSEVIERHINNPHPLIRELISINELESNWKNLLKNPRKYSTTSDVPSLIFSYVVANRWIELSNN